MSEHPDVDLIMMMQDEARALKGRANDASIAASDPTRGEVDRQRLKIVSMVLFEIARAKDKSIALEKKRLEARQKETYKGR